MTRPRTLPALLVLALAGTLLLPLRAADLEPFTVLSYNVQNWLATDRAIDGRSAPSTPKPESEKAAVVKIILAHRPAIVGVLEMGSAADLEDLRSRLKSGGLDYPHLEWLEGLDTERHVCLLSRFPIVDRHSRSRVPFDLEGRPNGIQRGILDVTVEPAPGYRLRLIGLHLKSRRPVPGTDQAALRAREAWLVRQTLNGILAKDPATRLLLFGDLNDTKDQYPIREILGPRSAPARLTDLPLADSRGERWTHYYQTADEYSRIDYLLASPALLPDIDRAKSGIDDSPQWRQGSDHRAIFVTIRPPSK